MLRPVPVEALQEIADQLTERLARENEMVRWTEENLPGLQLLAHLKRDKTEAALAVALRELQRAITGA